MSAEIGFAMRKIAGQFRFQLVLVWLFSGFIVVAFPSVTEASQNARGRPQEELLQIVQDPDLRRTNPEIVADAIRQLGENKVASAAKYLVDLLTFRYLPPETGGEEWFERRGRIDSGLDPLQDYPAFRAVYRIGEPTLPFLVHVIAENESDSLWGRNASLALQYVFLYQWGEKEGQGYRKRASAYLQGAAAVLKGEEAKRLLELAQKIEEF